MKRKLLTDDYNIKISTVNRLLTLSSTLHSVIKSLAKESGIRKNIKEVPEVCVMMLDVVKDVFGADFTRQDRTLHIATARHAACYILRTHSNLSLVMIAAAVGNKDHTTVINSLKRAKDLMSRNMVFRDKIKRVEEIILKQCVAA